MENALPVGWVRGEVSNLRNQASGHVYFSLKDAGAQLSAVLFRGDALRQKVRLRDGQQVLVFGRLSVYEARGQYQLVVREVVEDGVGRLQQEFEALKRRLAAEGLFEAARKRALPALPRTIGFVTSPTGAAVQDFLRILLRRGWRGRVVVLPARVQGAGAAEDMVEALGAAERLGGFDLLVIGRGGGSLEDLWAFNEEPLVRAVAACPIPIISAVGHEIDFTLCDFAADLRAETPSGAAEHISSGFVAAVERVRQLGEELARGAESALDERRQRALQAENRLRLLSPAGQIEQYALRLDDCANRLGAALRMGMQQARHEVAAAAAAWARVSPEAKLEQLAQQVGAFEKRLLSVSPASVVARGFVIMRDEAGRPLTRADAVSSGQRVQAEFADALVPMRVEQ
ncbi:exodeoxyribonuclease VII large subunit [Cephaloticoccus primus]|uniref:Exodeoxyribonuclease 7 large subunit n=1 Tax=Cephaloticoccus primus TaxID=1548207 RepID=A0A139SIZ1_9BACT|nr:exodeoxyribonuclease VII large subunit [Cephaloticoccus primus]